MQKLLKKLIRNEIAHFKMFDCKTFSLLEKINALKRNEKMKSRAFIEYLIKYDFIEQQSHFRRFVDTRVISFSDTNRSVAACEYRRYAVV
jgi:hypothetical protein